MFITERVFAYANKLLDMKVEALFISDVHLGSRGSNALELTEMLKKYEPEYLFIVGDFIDGWLLKRRHHWNQDFTNVIRKNIHSI